MTVEKPLNQLNKFFELAAEKTLSGSDQLVYLHLFNIFNRAHWTGTVKVTDKQLQELVRIYDSNGKPASIRVIQNAKARLKLKGFIDFKSGKGSDVTEYSLIKFTPVDTPPSSKNARVKDVEDVKTVTTTTATTRTHETSLRDNLSENSEEVKQAWFDCEGEKLKGGVAFGLIELEKVFGTQAVISAIHEASRANNRPRLSYNFVKAVLENQQKGGKARGKDSKPCGISTQLDDTARKGGGIWRNPDLPPGVTSRFASESNAD